MGGWRNSEWQNGSTVPSKETWGSSTPYADVNLHIETIDLTADSPTKEDSMIEPSNLKNQENPVIGPLNCKDPENPVIGPLNCKDSENPMIGPLNCKDPENLMNGPLNCKDSENPIIPPPTLKDYRIPILPPPGFPQLIFPHMININKRKITYGEGDEQGIDSTKVSALGKVPQEQDIDSTQTSA